MLFTKHLIKYQKLKPFIIKNISNYCTLNKNRQHFGEYALVNQYKIHYERVGTGDHTLFLMPGMLGSTRTDFNYQLNGFDKSKFTLIAWDPPGYGYSRPPDRDFKDFYRNDAKIGAQFMKTLGFNKYSVLGWSDGGITALIMSANETNSIEKLVVLSAKSYLTEYDLKMFKILSDLNNWSPKAKKTFLDLYGEQLLKQLMDNYIEEYSKYQDLCTNDLKKITQKCLIIHGNNDILLDRKHPQYLKDNIKNSTLYRFANGKHNIHQIYVKEFNSIVEKFLLQECEY